MHWADMVSSFFSTICSISMLLGALISADFQIIGTLAIEVADSMALLPFGSVSGIGKFIQCGGSRDITVADAQPVGVCYGRMGNNLPDVREVVKLYKSIGVGKMRIYEPNKALLNALRGSNIEIILGIPNSSLQSIANLSSATAWVQKNIQAYVPYIKFRYIAVGNEVQSTNANALYVLPAMQSIFSAIEAANLQDQMKVSTVIDTSVLGSSFPPSAGSFHASAKVFIEPIVSFLVKNRSPLLANVHPYFIYVSNPQNIRLDYALFTASQAVVTDGNVPYRNLFESIVDALYSALEKSGGANVSIMISESGWPSNGSTAATIENAGTYYRNLINYIQSKTGTPGRPGRVIETYLFAMFDENLKFPETEKHFGLFTPNTQPKYLLSFTKEKV